MGITSGIGAPLTALLLMTTSAWAGSLEALMADLAEVDEQNARFVEERTVGILDETLVTEGTLSYQAPDRLLRQDLLPDPAIYDLDGNRLRIVIDDEERVMALDQEPLLQAMIAPFRAILAGDLTALEASFDLAYADNNDRWKLTLTPKPASVSRPFLERIDIMGTARTVQRMDVHERDGDRSSMHLEDTTSSPSKN